MGSGDSNPDAVLPDSAIDEQCVRVIAQTIPGVSNLKSEVALALAPDAEYRIRQVIQQAKSFMQHARREKLTVADVAAAFRLRDRMHPVLGFRGCRDDRDLGFQRVPGAADLYVDIDTFVSLDALMLMDLPTQKPSPAIVAEWMADADHQQASDSTQHAQRTRTAHLEFQTYVKRITEAVMRSGDEAELEAALHSLSTVVSIEPLLPPLVRFTRRAVHDNARARGSTDTLANVTRLIYALVCNPHFGVEAYLDRLLPTILSCIVGRSLGSGDHWALREQAAQVLQATFQLHNDTVPRGRAAKTLLSVLTDEHATLETMFGAIHGLTAIGKCGADVDLAPHLPALFNRLETTLVATKDLDSASADVIRDRIEFVCEAVGLATGIVADINTNHISLQGCT